MKLKRCSKGSSSIEEIDSSEDFKAALVNLMSKHN